MGLWDQDSVGTAFLTWAVALVPPFSGLRMEEAEGPWPPPPACACLMQTAACSLVRASPAPPSSQGSNCGASRCCKASQVQGGSSGGDRLGRASWGSSGVGGMGQGLMLLSRRNVSGQCPGCSGAGSCGRSPLTDKPPSPAHPCARLRAGLCLPGPGFPLLEAS